MQVESYSSKADSSGSNMQRIFDRLPTVRSYEKGEIIYRQGDTATTFCYLKKGKVCVFMNSPDGMERTLSTACGGELLGEGAFFDGLPRVSSARAVTACEVVTVDKNTLTELFKTKPNLALELLEILSKRIRLLSTQLDSMTFLQARARIARLLICSEADGTVRLTHEEIASSVGVSRVTVSKTLSKLAARGIITTQYRKIIIKNHSRLREISESDTGEI